MDRKVSEEANFCYSCGYNLTLDKKLSNETVSITPPQITSPEKRITQMEPTDMRRKSTTTTLLLALIPGVIFMGLGHFYAGKKLRGLIFLTAGLTVIVSLYTVTTIISTNLYSLAASFLLGMCYPLLWMFQAYDAYRFSKQPSLQKMPVTEEKLIEEEPKIPATTSKIETKSQSKISRKRIIITILIIAVILTSIVYWFFIRPQSIPWLFKGAYGNYHGETVIMLFTVKLDLHLEVVDYNLTHAKLLMYMRMETPLGSQEFQNVTWYDLSKKSYNVGGYNVKRNYEQEIYIQGFGTRPCVVYEYESENSPRTIMTMYVDKNVGWPLKMKIYIEATQTSPTILQEQL